MSNTRISIDRPPSSSAEQWGPFHSVVCEDIEHIFGYRGQVHDVTLFTGIDLIDGGWGYDPEDPPDVHVRFAGRDYGVRAKTTVEGGRVIDIEITDWGLHGGHDPDYPSLEISVTWRFNEYTGAMELDKVTIINNGGGYTAPPVISWTEYGASHEDAVLQASLAEDGSVHHIDIISRGSYPRNMANPPPLPLPVISDPPSDYDVLPEILIIDGNENTSATAWPTCGGVIIMDDPGHRVNVGDVGGRLVFRDEADEVYQIPGIDITGVSGREVYFTMHLQSAPYDYNHGFVPLPRVGQRCWFLRPPSRGSVITPPAAGLGQHGWVKYNGLAKIVLVNPGSGYTPDKQYAVTISGGEAEEGASAIAIGNPDGTVRVQITNQGKNWTSPPLSVIVAPPEGGGHAATGYGVIYVPPEGEDAFTVRMANPWSHGINEGDVLQVLWKWGDGPWQHRWQCGRYNCTAVLVGNGCVTFAGGMNGPSKEPTTHENGGNDRIAGKAWPIPTEDDHLLSLFVGHLQKDVHVGGSAPHFFGAVLAVMRGTVDHDFVVEPLEDGAVWYWPEYWGWWTDLNSKARVT